MNIILGFGLTEENQRKIVYEWIFNKLKKKFNSGKYKSEISDDIVSEDFFNSFKKDFKKYNDKIYAEYEKADKSKDRPERYFHIRYGNRIAYDYDTIFVKIKFWHINSRHPFSPDGMSLMEYDETFTFCMEDFK